MAFTLATRGKYYLFNSGWTSTITTAKLYTATNTLVDTQSVTFSYSGGSISIASSIVFTISSPVNDVDYITIGDVTGAYFTQDLSSQYDFPTAGTLTITSWTIGISGSTITTDGKSALFQSGWASSVNYARLYNSSSVIAGTLGGLTFTSAVDTGNFVSDDNTLTFSITAIVTNIDKYEIGKNVTSTFTKYFGDLLRDGTGTPVTYTFNYDGTLSINGLYLTVAGA